MDGSKFRFVRSAYACAAAILFAGWTSPSVAQTVRVDRLQEHGTILRHPILPRAFRGHWSEDAAACDADAVDESQVWITGHAVNFFETNGHVVRVVAQDARHAVVTLREEGEGTVFTAKKGLMLSPDGASLTMRNQDDTGHVRFRRCRAKTSSG